MNAPLPEVPPFVAKKRDFAKAPLRSLNFLCALSALSAILWLLIHTPVPEFSRFWDWTYWTIVTALTLLHIYFLWRGYGLARGLWLWFTVLMLPLYFFWDEMFEGSRIEQMLTYFDLSFSLIMLVYLNLPNVKAHFAQRKTVE